MIAAQRKAISPEILSPGIFFKEDVMSDVQATTWFAETPAGQPGNVSPAPQAEQAPTSAGKPPAQTPDDLEARISKALIEHDRRIQAASDKRNNALRTEVDRLSKLVQTVNGGNAPTAEQAAVIHQQAEAALSDAPSPAAPGQVPSGSGERQAQAEQPPKNWKVELAEAALKKEGIELTGADPEAATLREALKSDDYALILQTVSQVAAARKERAGNQARVQTPTAGGGSLPGNPIAHITDTDTLFKMGMEKLRKGR